MISVGIDVSKGKSMVCIMKPGEEVLKPPFEILHTVEAILNLVHLIKSYSEDVRVIVEDTGHYQWPVVTLLAENEIFVCSVNALRMKKYCSQNIRRAKTDRIDSIRIAYYGITYWHELIPALSMDSTYRELRLLSRQYCQATNVIVKTKVNLSNLLDQVMPGLNTVIRGDRGNSKLTDFVKRYRHYGHILEMGEKKFLADCC